MKKYVIAMALVLAITGFAAAQTATANMTVTGTVSQKLWVQLPATLALGELNTAGGTGATTAGDAKVCSNVAAWTLKIWATNGKLVHTTVNTEKIDYTVALTFAGGSETRAAAALPTAEASASTVAFTRKTTGTSGENMTVTVAYAAQGSTEWLAGTYQDTINMKVTAP